jgi:hypothetical protein
LLQCVRAALHSADGDEENSRIPFRDG